MSETRRDFIKRSTLTAAGAYLGTMGLSAASYRRIIGANDRVNLGVVGFSDRFRNAHLPSFLQHYKELNFDIVALSDIWKLRREEGREYLTNKLGHAVQACRNNDELFDRKSIDGVFISTADFQHALHTVEAVQAKCDVYCEKPFAETMEDARMALGAVRRSGCIVQIGSQRRSGKNYQAAADFIASGKFGPITTVELTWNVNQPGRWRRPALVAKCREEDLDWKRFLLNRPYESFDPRKYLEYRLFWPYSSGQPGQWMSHQIDTVHWYTGLHHPRSVVANGGIYTWRDGRTNWDTTTAVFDYGPADDLSKGFQVIFMSRVNNGDEITTEIYYSNGGELNLNTNKISPKGGLTEAMGKEMGMPPNLLPERDLVDRMAPIDTRANAGGDEYTSAHVRNWMECIRSRKQPNAPVEAGYYHSIANIMTNAAVKTGARATFDEHTQEVMADGKVFKY
ncbi:Gfo/Idh/MocA family oxidoreductase [Flavitalea sp. BT771]|uniref:Gfo/Idh/MocA family protein n=1 Tax=Flavitalea sp. BT771 TaxID=3063329 RepID=UPI0026E2CA94|nr:Gfo/Idh/MocA family oxidoreductase [Flavitalea sp. BT771]MDO6430815.1 Gfo/Idh/MocA family oxidoreductase [Flavitalea sp. BT771]MDV6219045.1 Gfo/Idh/MocA family oxidoreductase [Flavitalea sp. BT771]